MRFAILGPLLVNDPSGRQVPRGDRQMRLLAILLLAEDRPVPAEVVERAVYGETVPPGAAEEIRRMIGDWRDWLPDDQVSEFGRIGSGHRIRVHPDELDIHRFRRLVERARGHLKPTDEGSEPEIGPELAADALRILDEALGLWRGRPLEGLSGPGIDEGVAKMLEFKAEVDEIRYGAQVRLKRYGDIIREARQVLRVQPMHEDATRRLMASLAETGREVEAARAYQDLEAHLTARAGRRPRREMQDFAARLEGGDRPAGGFEEYSAEVTSGWVRAGLGPPRQLTARVRDFEGREAELHAVGLARENGHRGVVVSGIGGVGKTALGLEFAHRHLPHFFDGQLYADLRGAAAGGPAEPLMVLHGFLRALGFDPDVLPGDVDQAGAYFRSYAADRHLLVFLDNAADADQVRPLLAGAGDAFVIVTSRTRLAGLEALDGLAALELAEMTTEDSMLLLGGLLGEETVTEFREEAGTVVAACGGLPLALRIAADLVVDVGFARTVELIEHGSAIERIRLPGEDRTDLRRVFDLSYPNLSAAERRLHLMLAPLPGRDFSEDLALALGRSLDADPARLLDALVRAHWIRRIAPGRYEVHNLVAEYAAQRAEREWSASERRLVRDRVIAHYQRLSPDVPLEEYDFLTAAYKSWWHYPNASRLASVLCSFAQREHLPAELVRLGMRGAAAVAEASAGSGLGAIDLARHCNLVAVAAYVGNDLETSVAYGRRTVDATASEPGGDRFGTARANLGGALARLGRYGEARAILSEALTAAETSGAWDGTVTTLLSLAHACRGLGDDTEAEAHLMRALDIDRQRSRGLRENVITAHLDELRRRSGVANDGAAR